MLFLVINNLSIFSVLREHIVKENDSVSMAKDFLRKQRHSLKRRQSALLAAKQELMKDVVKQRQGVGLGMDKEKTGFRSVCFNNFFWRDFHHIITYLQFAVLISLLYVCISLSSPS